MTRTNYAIYMILTSGLIVISTFAYSPFIFLAFLFLVQVYMSIDILKNTVRITRTNYAIYFILINGLSIIISQLSSFFPNLYILVIPLLFPQLYIAIGRLKDMNANPWWSLLTLLPFVGFILMFPKGTLGINQYGKDPRVKGK
ncbi:DUF805 domain-containing protein [Actinobacillus minor]|uniref:DUF805 domain-containing protein n=1 Tax=Actinobacillus minor TaxID=51047 RepID=UPI0025FD8590|nr:DUF805 domain-containing protein [Actinobacillus minor]